MSFGTEKSKNKVDNTLETEQATIAREQYDDYLNRFKPVEDEVLADIQNDTGREIQIARAGELSDAGFHSALKSSAMQQSRTGFKPVANDGAKVGERRFGLARALANVNTQNQTRSTLRDRLLEMTANQIGVGRGIANAGSSGLSTAAQLEAAENARKRRANAQEDSDTAQGVGTAVAAVASYASSREYKENIHPIAPADLLALIQQIETVGFEYKPEFKTPGSFIGAIAEDVPAEFANKQRTGLNDYNLIGALIGSVKALAQRITELENK